MSNEQVTVADGKYTVVIGEGPNAGQLSALRHGEPWQDMTGNNLVYYLAVELRDARLQLAAQAAQPEIIDSPETGYPSRVIDGKHAPCAHDGRVSQQVQAPQPAENDLATEAAESVNETNAALASRYIELTCGAQARPLSSAKVDAIWDELTPEGFGKSRYDIAREIQAALFGTPPPAPIAGLHVGDSRFESWFGAYSPAGKSSTEQARDAYAAGMSDPLVVPVSARAALDEQLIEWCWNHSHGNTEDMRRKAFSRQLLKTLQGPSPQVDPTTWSRYVAGMIGCYLNWPEDDKRVEAVAGIIERRRWAQGEAQRDTDRLDYLQRHGATLELVPAGRNDDGTTILAFRVGGLHAAVSVDLRAALDLARGVWGQAR